ncbi:MAG: serine--tRNA ligase [Nanoarchaeota archaeon]|nr:serine--tRNA ligase [Nanoarchaeota archaeon]
MIDIKLIRENPEIVKENIKKKFQNERLPLVDKVLDLDKKWRALKAQSDSLRSERNKVSKEISELKKAKKNADAVMKRAQEIPDKIAECEAEMAKLEQEINVAMLKIPNIIYAKTPSGKSDKDNVEAKKWGKVPKFDFPIKTHVELAENLGIADFDASAKVSGNGFYYIKGDLALLNQALIRFTLDHMVKKRYTYIEPPLMLNDKSIYASMDKTAIEQSVYSIKDEDLNLIGTAEQSVLAMHSEQTIPEWELPKKYFAYSMCFRKEVGAHGINEKGLWRTHQFNKVEQFVFCKPEDSEEIYDELLQNSEEILQALKLPYRVLEICTGDLADWKFRSADLEVWRPTTKSYGELMSLSNCTDYQARKLGIKCLDKKGDKRILHTLNNTALATSRAMVAILENYQQKDGTIKVPDVLLPYMHGIKVIGKKK